MKNPDSYDSLIDIKFYACSVKVTKSSTIGPKKPQLWFRSKNLLILSEYRPCEGVRRAAVGEFDDCIDVGIGVHENGEHRPENFLSHYFVFGVRRLHDGWLHKEALAVKIRL